MEQPGIYVETFIHAGLDRIWELTQDPALHQRWDLRFTTIQYLPRETVDQPQKFLYETRIGFGLRIHGTGESIGQIQRGGHDTISSLKFASQDPKSLIRSGSGYWRYIPQGTGLRFLTWYDYDVRLGPLGRLFDRAIFRPLIGWATAWSFDRLRLWAEESQSPEVSLILALIHAIARLSIAFIWLWHGLVPKLLFRNFDERTMLSEAGLSPRWLTAIGVAELLMALLVLVTWNRPRLLLANAIIMVLATLCVALRSPEYLTAAFNPVTLNLSVIALSIVGWLAARSMPRARRCLHSKPRGSA